MNRRKFIILTGVGATTAGVLTACGNPENKLIPALIPDEEYVPGIDYWKASSCALCSAGCGILVRTREHKANKIEGNPLHPINRGALCARGQAGLEVLYNPDRIRGPMKRIGERAAGQFAQITWDEAIKTLADKLGEINAQKGAVVFATRNRSGVTGLFAEWLATLVENISLVHPDYTGEAWGNAYEQIFGRRAIPTFDIANATYLLSFGARFLETWHSPVQYSLEYGNFRRTSGRARGRFVQIEPRMSLTGANADEWLPAAPGTEALLADSIAMVIEQEGLTKRVDRTLVRTSIEGWSLESAAQTIGLSAEKIVRIAREFAGAERPLAIAGFEPGFSLEPGLPRVLSLNNLVGNVGKPGGVQIPYGPDVDPFANVRPKQSARWLSSFGETPDNAHGLLIHQVNPVWDDPRVADKLKAIPFIASFSSFLDESTEFADLVLPDHSYLESWDLSATQSNNRAVLSIRQPVIKPQLNTRQTGDVLIALANQLDGRTPPGLDFTTSEEAVRRASLELAKTRGSISEDDPDEFWKSFSANAVWIGSLKAQPTVVVFPQHSTNRTTAEPSPAEADFPFILHTYEHPALGSGDTANLPSLQELPDPMTTAMWGSWVEINPRSATALGIADGDMIEVETSHGRLRAPAVLYPAIRPDVIAMPYGQGHTSFGRYARDRGVNPALLRRHGETRVVRAKISKVSGEGGLIRFGTNLPEHFETKR